MLPLSFRAAEKRSAAEELAFISFSLSQPPPPLTSTTTKKQTVLGIILGGGAGSRLYPLTKKRAKPAVPLGANYRLIDIPVSNCINSGVNKVYTLTQFNSASLNRHLAQAYNVNVGGYRSRGFVEVLAASQSVESKVRVRVFLCLPSSGAASRAKKVPLCFARACQQRSEETFYSLLRANRSGAKKAYYCFHVLLLTSSSSLSIFQLSTKR